MTALPRVFPSVIHMLAEAALHAPRREALVCGDDRLTYGSYAQSVANLANRLKQAGAEGGRVAILMPNSADLAIALLGAIAAGAQATPLNPAYTPHELGPILADADPVVVIIAAEIATKINGFLSSKTMVITVGGHGAERLICSADTTPSLPLPDPDSLGILQYTGGTTGRPKGVDLTNRAVAINVSQREALVPTTQDRERTLLMTPLYHVYAASMCLYLSLYARGTLVILPTYTPELALRAIETESITFFAGSPTIYQGLLVSPRMPETDFSTLSLCFSGASALPAEVLRRWQEITGSSVCEGYGQTEAGPVVAANPRYGSHKLGSVGVILPRTDVEIVSTETDAVLPAGETGEIRVRGPQLMQGYRNMPDETRNTLRSGWLYTGDIGHLDATGYLHVTGRKKEMVIVSGFNVFPREVEDVLYSHPSVQEVAAFGVPHHYKGEALHCATVCKDGVVPDEAELLAYLSERLVRYKVPSVLRIVPALPKTAVGKIDKTALRQSAMET
jgi:long-chain acyl-CoA synthetase